MNNMNFGTGFNKLGGMVEELVGRDKALCSALNGTSIDVGMAKDPKFGIPSHAADSAIFAGDEAFRGNKIISAAAEAMLKTDPSKVQIRPQWNPETEKFDQRFMMNGDAGFDPLAGQLFSPWNITYLSKVWKEPLAYSNARQLVKTEHGGSNPFAEIFTFFLEQYAGWGVIGQTGDLQNIMANDVNVQNGMASFPIINMMGTYTLTLEEKRRKTWGPVGSSPLGRKQSYLNYVMDMMECIMMLYGNEETNTLGLLDINPIKIWPTGKSLKAMVNSTTTTTRGSDIFRMLAAVVNDFMTRADNKWSKIKIGLSPEAYNYLTSTTYSDNFDATTAMKTFGEAYLAGKGPGHQTPSIEFVAEPLLKASSNGNINPCNPNPFDYMTITAPTIGGGPENEQQATNFFVKVLDKFVFPVIPGMYNDQYKTLRRVAGMVAPIPAACEVWAGFGVQGDE